MKIEDLVKHFGGLASHFKKAAAFHAEMHKVHDSHAAFMKSKVEAMPDDHPDKAFHKATHAMHGAKADLHKAYAAHLGGVADGMAEAEKAAKSGTFEAIANQPALKCSHEIEMTKACKDCKREDKPAEAVAVAGADKVDMGAFMKDIATDALKALKADPDFQKSIQASLKRQLEEQLGKITVPDQVRGATPDNPTRSTELTLVPRFGGPTEADLEKSMQDVDPEMAHLVSR
jgi:hypothetical protein